MNTQFEILPAVRFNDISLNEDLDVYLNILEKFNFYINYYF